MQVIWYSPRGETIEFNTGAAATHRLIALDGIGPLPVGPQSLKSPKQAGASPTDVLVDARVVTLQALVQAASNEALWPLRAALSKALVSQPVRSGESIELGILRVFRDGGLIPVELEAIVRSASMPAPRGGVGLLAVDVEFWAPQPYWRELYDTEATMESSGGFEWDLEFGLEMETNNIEIEIDNQGDVDAPFVARLYGECTDPLLKNVTYDQQIGIIGDVDAGDYIEIDTSFGVTIIESVSGGVHTSAMDLLALDTADDFWPLRPGLNLVRFEASPNTSGRGVVLWRERYAGI